MPLGACLRHFAHAERTVRADRAATDDTLSSIGLRIGCGADFRDPCAEFWRRRYFLGELARRDFAIRKHIRHAPIHAELRVDARLWRPLLGNVTAHDIQLLRTNYQFNALDICNVAAKQRMQLKRRADRRMGKTATRVGLDRETVEFPRHAKPAHSTIGLKAVVQIDPAQTVFPGEWVLDARQSRATHQRCRNGVRRCKSGLHMFRRCTFPRGLMIAAGEAVNNSERVSQHVRTRIDQPGCGQRRAKMTKQRRVYPATLNEIEPGRHTQPAGQFDTQQYGLAEFLAAHRAAQARNGERCRYCRRTSVKGGFVMRIIEFEHVAIVAITQRRCNCRDARPADNARVGPSARIDQNLEPRRQSGRRAPRNGRAEIVKQFAPHVRARGFRHLFPTQRLGKCNEGIESLFRSCGFVVSCVHKCLLLMHYFQQGTLCVSGWIMHEADTIRS